MGHKIHKNIKKSIVTGLKFYKLLWKTIRIKEIIKLSLLYFGNKNLSTKNYIKMLGGASHGNYQG